MKRDNRRSGQTMVEYIIIVVVIGVAALAIFGIFGDTLREKFAGATSTLTTTDNRDKAQEEADKDSAEMFRAMDKTGLSD